MSFLASTLLLALLSPAQATPSSLLSLGHSSSLTLEHSLPYLGLDRNFADPCIAPRSIFGYYYSFATTSITDSTPNGVNVQTAYSPDLASWTYAGTDALPGPFPSWVWSTPSVWAPDVIRNGDGGFVMYYAARSQPDGRKHCIGTATSAVVQGPYTPTPGGPLACPLDQGGAIDADGFRDDDGTYYVVYKVDGSNLNVDDEHPHPTPLMLQKMANDALTPVGEPVVLLDRDDSDGPLIEAPSMAKINGTYVLIFSSHMYNVLGYNLKYATAPAVTGPYTRAAEPLLQTGDASNAGKLAGPGSGDFSEDGKTILFHEDTDGRDVSEGRRMFGMNVNFPV